MTITYKSAQSLFLEFHFDDTLIATGTGFIADTRNGPVLVTNRHNVTGRDQVTRKPLHSKCAVPNNVKIWHHIAEKLGSWVAKTEALFHDTEGGKKRWIEHPRFVADADFVALPLVDTQGITWFPIEFTGPDIMIGPSETISVVGFPFGKSVGGKFAIWANGTIASEPDIDYEDKPVLLIDCRSRKGQSGSPVIAFRSGGGVSMRDGGTTFFDGPVSKFIGIYSGRINQESDLGIVWKASAIQELIDSI